jgi:LPS O-antigen subunit length determinant protein (WzzB/FepE family)
MTEFTGEPRNRDYGCEMIGAVVLLALSALSRFWLIAIAAAGAIALWGTLLLLKETWRFTARRVAAPQALERLKGAAAQVFPLRKLRQSVDC